MSENTKIKDLYNLVKGDRGELNSDWIHNVGVYVPIMDSDITTKELVDQFSMKIDFSIDGITSHSERKHLINSANKWLIEQYPDVTYSKISKYLNPCIIEDGLSVNHVIVNIKRHIINKFRNLSSTKSVIEIGAGYGALAREIFLCNTNMKYVIIDLPESLLCSYSYLSLEFPDKKHLILSDVSDLDKPFDFLYVPTKTLELFLSSKIITDFDLFVNTCSMGEMTRSVVDKYYDMVTNVLNVKSVYWLNRFLNCPNGPHRRNEMWCSLDIPKTWHVKHWEYIPLYLRCPDVLKAHAIMTEIYAEIKKTNDSLDNKSVTNQTTLFSLWNEMRLSPNKIAADSITKEIKTINPGAEELWYYEEYTN